MLVLSLILWLKRARVLRRKDMLLEKRGGSLRLESTRTRARRQKGCSASCLQRRAGGKRRGQETGPHPYQEMWVSPSDFSVAHHSCGVVVDELVANEEQEFWESSLRGAESGREEQMCSFCCRSVWPRELNSRSAMLLYAASESPFTLLWPTPPA